MDQLRKLGTLHWQTIHWLLGMRVCRTAAAMPRERDYLPWLDWGKGKVKTRKMSQKYGPLCLACTHSSLPVPV